MFGSILVTVGGSVASQDSGDAPIGAPTKVIACCSPRNEANQTDRGHSYQRYSLLSTALLRPVLFPIYAHEGGWDEVLLVAIPLGLIGGLLWVANRRVNSQLEEAARSNAGAQPDGSMNRPDTEDPRSLTDP